MCCECLLLLSNRNSLLSIYPLTPNPTHYHIRTSSFISTTSAAVNTHLIFCCGMRRIWYPSDPMCVGLATRWSEAGVSVFEKHLFYILIYIFSSVLSRSENDFYPLNEKRILAAIMFKCFLFALFLYLYISFIAREIINRFTECGWGDSNGGMLGVRLEVREHKESTL